jgi:hypothetical protein
VDFTNGAIEGPQETIAPTSGALEGDRTLADQGAGRRSHLFVRGSQVMSVTVLGAAVDLSHPAHYVHWHFFQMSVPNVVVIVLMIVVFILAIALPFPRHGEGG